MPQFSSSAKNMRSSEIRKLMKLAADPSIISFSGGMPNNELFPCEVVEELYINLPLIEKQNAFQYSPTSGYPPLLKSLKKYLRSKGLPVDKNDLIITTGAQQAINILAKVFINPGDTVITEYPSFIGAIAAFKSFGAKLIGVELDNDGISIEKLETLLKRSSELPKILYLSPYFHNPAGIIYSNERKKNVLKLVNNYDVCVIEDDPYSELYFDETSKEMTLSMKAISNDSHQICYIGSFAKILGPGIRLGYLLAPKAVIEKCELAKQSMDACSSTFTQVIANGYLEKDKLPLYLNKLRPIYRRRSQLMLKALKEYMPDYVSWTKPQGGFYIWVKLPEKLDSSDVFNRCINMGAAFVIGKAFDPEGKRNNCFRLAFSHTPEEKIEEGIKIVCNAIKDTK